jgi:hypothetical protein
MCIQSLKEDATKVGEDVFNKKENSVRAALQLTTAALECPVMAVATTGVSDPSLRKRVTRSSLGAKMLGSHCRAISWCATLVCCCSSLGA